MQSNSELYVVLDVVQDIVIIHKTQYNDLFIFTKINFD